LINPGFDDMEERFTLTLSETVVAGTPREFELSGYPKFEPVSLRPVHKICIKSDVPYAGLFTITTLKFGNVSVLSQGESVDAYHYRAPGQYDTYPIGLFTRVSAVCRYTGKIPENFQVSNPCTLRLILVGTARKGDR
jgi:hypothetical protein